MLEKFTKIAHIFKCLANNPKNFFNHLDHVSAHVKSQSTSFYQALIQTLVPIISPEIIDSITTTVMAVMTKQNRSQLPLYFSHQYQVNLIATLRSYPIFSNIIMT